MLFSVLSLDVLLVESCKYVISDVESLICCDDRCATIVSENHCILLLSIVLVDESLDCIAELVHHYELLLLNLLLLLSCIVLELDILLLKLLILSLCY